jgi:hypothetical protein
LEAIDSTRKKLETNKIVAQLETKWAVMRNRVPTTYLMVKK